MKVLMVSGEAVPFCKTGGLADVVGALSPALVKLGHDARVLIPLYGSIKKDGMTDTGLEASVRVAGRETKVSFLKKDVGPVPYYFVRHPSFTTRNGVYGETSFAPYSDNIERYTILDKAALELCKLLGWKPDVVHCHDWTAGLIPYLLKTGKDPFFKGTRTMITIHNLAYQGDFSRLDALKCDMPLAEGLYKGSGSEARVNLLKAGIAYSDEVTTVSPTYAKEILGDEYGCGLNGLLEQRKDSLTGILNGIDYTEWNSETDPFLPGHFNKDDLKGKAVCKSAAQKQFGLKVDPSVPLISLISRIAEQKGFTALLDGEPCALERIVRDLKVQLIIIGTGDEHYAKKMLEIGKRYPNLSVNILFSNKAAHLAEAASDYFLMPSRFEPCGLNQLYSLRYGTLPIVRKTGGLADSVVDLDQHPHSGTGFVFETLSGAEIEQAVRRALSYWPDLDEVRARAMSRNLSWDTSAKAYASLYERKTPRR